MHHTNGVSFCYVHVTRRNAHNVTYMCCHAHHLKPETDLHAHTSENT
jgi:hypothetical protein